MVDSYKCVWYINLYVSNRCNIWNLDVFPDKQRFAEHGMMGGPVVLELLHANGISDLQMDRGAWLISCVVEIW